MNETKPSKSARKREYLALQKLGEELIPLHEQDLRAIGLDEDLLEAILEAKLMSKLMGRVDPEPIKKALWQVRSRG